MSADQMQQAHMKPQATITSLSGPEREVVSLQRIIAELMGPMGRTDPTRNLVLAAPTIA